MVSTTGRWKFQVLSPEGTIFHAEIMEKMSSLQDYPINPPPIRWLKPPAIRFLPFRVIKQDATRVAGAARAGGDGFEQHGNGRVDQEKQGDEERAGHAVIQSRLTLLVAHNSLLIAFPSTLIVPRYHSLGLNRSSLRIWMVSPLWARTYSPLR